MDTAKRADRAPRDVAEADASDKKPVLLQVRDLVTYFYVPDGVIKAVDGASFDATTEDGAVNFIALTDIPFVRGDANDDGRVNVADAVTILAAKLIGGATLVCEAAGDANGDETANMADAIYVLQYRFLHGPVPAEPFPLCGIDAGADCAEFASCD